MSDKIDFSYSFAAPHRITLSLPSSSHKTLCDVTPDGLTLSWSWRSLLDSTYDVWQTPRVEWRVAVSLYIDGKRLRFEDWRRGEGGVPEFVMTSSDGGVKTALDGAASGAGDVVRLGFTSSDGAFHRATVLAEHLGGWVISNPAWVDGKNTNVLTCMQGERADRIMLAVFGGSCREPASPEALSGLTGPDGAAVRANPGKCVIADFCVPASGETAGWLVRPYAKYADDDIDELVSLDFAAALEGGRSAWRGFIGSHARPVIPDAEMAGAFDAALSDLFVMRERLRGNNWSVTCGTEVYRSPNDCEPISADLIFDRLGYEKEVGEDLAVHLGGAGKDGNWNTPGGWARTGWLNAGKKAQLAWEHYRLTSDVAFLRGVYPAMRANSAWQRRARRSTLNDPDPSKRGLMSRGMGDCGMMCGSDYFGVFYPHNCYSLLADELTRLAAAELGYADDVTSLDVSIAEAKAALAASMRANAVESEGVKYIPSGPDAKASTSRFGALYAAQTGVLPFGDELIQGTLKVMERDVSEGGLPKNLGWLRGGLWVAIALDNISELYLREGKGDEAVKYLYPTVNHASRFVTWCEERGAEAGSGEKSGDPEHLWTPVALCAYLLDALCLDTPDGLVLASGTPRSWLGTGMTVGADGLRVPGGTLSYRLTRESGTRVKLTLVTSGFAGDRPLRVRLRLPQPELKPQTLICSDCCASAGGGDIVIDRCGGKCAVTAELG